MDTFSCVQLCKKAINYSVNHQNYTAAIPPTTESHQHELYFFFSPSLSHAEKSLQFVALESLHIHILIWNDISPVKTCLGASHLWKRKRKKKAKKKIAVWIFSSAPSHNICHKRFLQPNTWKMQSAGRNPQIKVIPQSRRKLNHLSITAETWMWNIRTRNH